MRFDQRALPAFAAVSGMGACLVLLSLGNEHLLSDMQVANGVHWIYLPAGLRMCYVLVLPVQGTAAIFGASVFMASRDPSLSWLLVAVSATATALGPVLARTVAVQRMGLLPNLENLSTRRLWALAAIFGLFSTSVHQAFYVAIGRDAAFFSMWVGDTLGCLLCLYGLKTLAMLWRQLSSR